MNNRKLLCSGLLAFSLFSTMAMMWAPSVMAQSASTGSLSGIITDPSGAVIPKAEVTVTNIATGQSHTSKSGLDGAYRVSLLPPGKYKVTVSMAGFKTTEFPSVTVNVTETSVLNCRLEIGVPNETFTVESNAEVLQTSTSTLGTLVGNTEVTSLPLVTRNYTQILDLSAGVVANVSDATVLGKGTQYTQVNGSNAGQNNYQMDGVSINSMGMLANNGDQNVGAGIGIPNPDSIQEFMVQTSNYDASYGRNPGANVNVVTKSGSNQFHGSAFEFLRNTDLNANPFFYNRDNPDADTTKPVLNQNQFGATLGGPIVKDKFFFFGSYQGTRQTNGISGGGLASVLLPPIPAGDRSAPGFAAALGAASCGFGTFIPGLGANVACDGSNINPVALKILQLKLADGNYYVPGSGTAGYRQVDYSDPATYSGNQFLINADYLITPKETLATRYFYTRDPQTLPLNGNVPGNPTTNFYSNHNVVINLTSILSNNFTNVAHVSYHRDWGNLSDTPPPGATPANLGLTPMVPTENEMPEFFLLSGPTLFTSFNPANSLASHFQYGDQIAWVHDKHTIRAGFDYERVQFFSNPGFSRGWLLIGTFNDFLVGGPGNIFECLACAKGTGQMGEVVHGYRMNNLDSFFQDDWKIGPRLTLNLGLRWEYDGMFSDKYGNLTNIWPSQIATVPVPPTGPTTSGPGLAGYVVPDNTSSAYGPLPAGVLKVDNGNSIAAHPPYSNFAPRFGFAWQPTAKGNLVVRAGFGLFYDRTWADSFIHGLQQNPPYAITTSYGPGNPQTLQNPFPNLSVGIWNSRWSNLTCQPDGTSCTGTNSNLNLPFLNPYIHTPLTRQYNMSIQYEFVRNWVLEVGYVGMSAINLIDIYHNNNAAMLASPSNPINGQIANTLANVDLRVPYLGYQPTGLQGTQFDGNSNYNSLQATIRKQFSYGLMLQGSYTYSKNLSDVGYACSTCYLSKNANDPTSTSDNYGPTSFSRPQRFILNYRYDLPLGAHQGMAEKFLKGWSITGITTIQDGNPLTFTDASAGSIYGMSGSSLAQMCSGATYASAVTPGSTSSRLGGNSRGPGYYNASAFCAPPTGGIYGNGTGYGNSGIGVVLGPGQFNWDISLIKDTKIKEQQTIQFRAEFYNAFNHPQFGNPDTGVRDPTFGQITSTIVNPRIIQFGLKYTF